MTKPEEPALLIAVLGQKGGILKSAIARMIAAEYARQNWNVKVGDMDYTQGTSFEWQQRRMERNIQPHVPIEMFRNVDDALKVRNNYDAFVFDGSPRSSRATLQMAVVSDLIILPTSPAVDDLRPTVKLANELEKKGVNKDRIAFALVKVGESQIENEEAANYIRRAGYFLLEGFIPFRVSYRQALDVGKTIMETAHPSLNEKAATLMRSIVNRIEELHAREAVDGH